MMLEELQNLQTLIKQLNTQYVQNKKELTDLKAKPVVAASEVKVIQKQQQILQKNFTDLQSKYDDLAHEMSKLTKKYHEKNHESEQLSAKVAHLESERNELLAKNEISSQRAQTILERLAALDNAGGN